MKKVFKIECSATVNNLPLENFCGYFSYEKEGSNVVKGLTDNALLYGYYNSEKNELNFIKFSESEPLLYTTLGKSKGAVHVYCKTYNVFGSFRIDEQSVKFSVEEISEDEDKLSAEILETFAKGSSALSFTDVLLFGKITKLVDRDYCI